MRITGVLPLALAAIFTTNFQSAFAAAQLRLSSGGEVFTISDQGAGDLGGGIGAVTFIGEVGGFEINVSTGITQPALGSSLEPHLDLNSVNTSTSPGVIEIEFTDDGFTPGAFEGFLAHVGGTTTGTPSGPGLYPVTFRTYAGIVPFDRLILLTDMGFGESPFAGSDSTGPISFLTPFSITIVATISHAQAQGGSTSFDHEIAGTLAAPNSPTELTEELIGLVSTLGLQGGAATSLDAKLEAALQALQDLNENNNGAAANVIRAFINATQAQSGKSLSETEAAQLIAAAQAILDLIALEP